MFVDEAHLCPAETFSKVVNGINAKVKIALSATPWRKDGLHVILPDYFGPNRVIATDVGKLIPSVDIVKTTIPFRIINPSRDWTKQLTKLGGNTAYLNIIASHAINKIASGRCLLILSERIDMLEQLKTLIPRSILLVGATKNRDDILNNAGTKYDAILTTKIFDEGISCHRLDTIYLTCPNNNAAKLEQRIGRIQREHPDKKDPLIVDFWLSGHIVQAQQRNRLEWYTKNNFPILNE
jgi:superfamily II DNA or RNA helicase